MEREAEIRDFCGRRGVADPREVAEKFALSPEEAERIVGKIRRSGAILKYPRTAAWGFKEKNYQSFILDYLVTQQGWVERADANFDRAHAMDPELLIRFIQATQPDVYAQVRKIYKARADKVVVEALNTQLVGNGLVAVLKNGFQIEDVPFSVYAPKPDAPYNKKAWNDYNANVFSVAQEVRASDKERIDLVLFLNGLAILAIELKDNNAGQNCEDAKHQWRYDRSPKTRLFMPKGGVLAMFAVDLEQVWMTTELRGGATRFLPFNKGANAGSEEIDCGAGNPPPPAGKYAVHYLWEETFAKDRVLEILTRYVFVEHGEETDAKGKKHPTETVIFPRYHQLDVVTKLIADVQDNGTARNYLIQHSAGSGKTNSITWLAYRLASLFSGGQKPGEAKVSTFDHVIVMTDRRVVIRQLQAAIKQLEKESGYVKCIEDDDPSSDLSDAFKYKKRIIATGIKRFAYIQDLVANMSGKRFAVIIDEAHSSTKGKSMIAVKRVLGADYDAKDEPDVLMQKLMSKQAKQKNVSMFAFTATPRAETIQLFGQHAGGGRKGVFHTYSMKQAIEEGFILDVLKNYTEYATLYEIEKKVAEDPVFKVQKAKSLIARYALAHPETVKERTKVIVDHFLENSPGRLNGNAKAMVVTSSRQEAVAYWEEIRRALKARGKDFIQVFVAFSGALQHHGRKVEEHNLNGFAEDALPAKFKAPNAKVLVVADKYQTGFDQKFLSFMYVLKKLNDVAAVQTLSRLNRICPPYAKETFVLDFVNTAADIARSFAPYYRSTFLNNAASPVQLQEAASRLGDFMVFDLDVCNDYWTALCQKDEPAATALLVKAAKKFYKLAEADQAECLSWMKRFDALYPFVAQAVNLVDSDLFLIDQFVHALVQQLNHVPPVDPIDLGRLIALKRVSVKKAGSSSPTPGPSAGTSLPKVQAKAEVVDLEERLSRIIAEINSEHGVDLSVGGGAKSCLAIKEQMMADRTLKAVAAEDANDENDFKIEAEKKFKKFVGRAYTDSDEFFKFITSHDDVLHVIFEGLVKDVYREMKGKE